MRNRPAVLGALLLVGFGLVAAFAPLIAPADPLKTTLTLEGIYQPPAWDHIAGTDSQGRDVLSRTIFGARIAWQIVLAAIGVAIVMGVPLGLLAGYIGGKLDELVLMRIVDAFMAMPGLVLILAVTAALGPSIQNTMIIIGVVWSPGYARLTRGVVLQIKQEIYIDAAHAIGAAPARVMLRHMLPNVVAPVLVLASLSAAGIILVEAGLSFIGAGVQPPTPAWGGMVRQGLHHDHDAQRLAHPRAGAGHHPDGDVVQLRGRRRARRDGPAAAQHPLAADRQETSISTRQWSLGPHCSGSFRARTRTESDIPWDAKTKSS